MDVLRHTGWEDRENMSGLISGPPCGPWETINAIKLSDSDGQTIYDGFFPITELGWRQMHAFAVLLEAKRIQRVWEAYPQTYLDIIWYE